jgi:hypothetical protein
LTLASAAIAGRWLSCLANSGASSAPSATPPEPSSASPISSSRLAADNWPMPPGGNASAAGLALDAAFAPAAVLALAGTAGSTASSNAVAAAVPNAAASPRRGRA